MRTRRTLKLTGMAALAAMLFLQAAFALAACGLERPGAAQALGTLAQQADDAPCHQPQENAGLCLAHCQSGEQALDKPQVKVPPLVFSTPMPAVRAWLEPYQAVAAGARLPLPVAGPPRHILFQSLLI